MRGSKLVTIIIVVFVITILTGVGYLVFDRFFKEKQIESFLKDDVIFVTKFNLGASPDQLAAAEVLSEKLGDKDLLAKTLTGIVLTGLNEDEIKGLEDIDSLDWVGNELAIARIRTFSDEEDSLFILKLGDPEQGKEFINNITDRIENIGAVVTRSDFRDQEIVDIQGDVSMAYTVFDDYLVITSGVDGIKQTIDVAYNRYPQLAKNKEYKKISKKFSDKGIASVYGDVSEIMAVLVLMSEPSSKVFIDQIKDIYKDTNLGGVFTAEEDGFRLDMYIKSVLEEKPEGKDFASSLASLAPADSIFFFEGEDAGPFLRRLVMGESTFETSPEELEQEFKGVSKFLEGEIGVSLESIMELVSGRYVAFITEGITEEDVDISLLFEVGDSEDTLVKMESVESLLSGYISKAFSGESEEESEISEDFTFKTQSIGDLTFRIIDLPNDQYRIDLIYAVVDGKLVITTSKHSLEKIVNIINGKSEGLASSSVYKESQKRLGKEKYNQFYYLSIEKPIISLVQQLTGTEVTEEQFDKYKAFKSVILGNEKVKGGNDIEGFLFIHKED